MLVSLVRRYDQVPWLHQMREIIRRWWKIDAIYIDKENQPIFMSGQPEEVPNRVCAACLSDPSLRSRCLDSMAQALQETQRPGFTKNTVNHSCHLGMANMMVPIQISDHPGGMIYTTGFFNGALTPAEEQAFLDRGSAMAPELGERDNLNSIPILTRDRRDHLADILSLGQSAVVTLFAELRAKEAEIEELRQRLKERQGFSGLVGSSAAMQEVYRLVERVAVNDCTVLIRGESGTGKELVAGAVHSLSARARGPFVVQNCSAFNDNLLESELFGHIKGAFTGAVNDKKGLFELASSGTLFLDEVAEMSAALQAKLLRVLQDLSFWPVGATTPRKSDVRILAATHRDLEQMIQQGLFREDLYYRLNVISIVMPPLRDRRGDIPALVEHFLRKHGADRVDPQALRLLCQYDWPGNVRELANEVERMKVLHDGKGDLDRSLISARILKRGDQKPAPSLKGTLREALGELEASMIRVALSQHQGNRSHAAKTLGIARSNLIAKIKTYSIKD